LYCKYRDWGVWSVEEGERGAASVYQSSKGRRQSSSSSRRRRRRMYHTTKV